MNDLQSNLIAPSLALRSEARELRNGSDADSVSPLAALGISESFQPSPP
jgi:hypothetical protein